MAVHYADGSLLLEQTKGALKQNPISDWADDLWKSFENWRAMLVAEEIDLTMARYRLFVTPQSPFENAAQLCDGCHQARVIGIGWRALQSDACGDDVRERLS